MVVLRGPDLIQGFLRLCSGRLTQACLLYDLRVLELLAAWDEAALRLILPAGLEQVLLSFISPLPGVLTEVFFILAPTLVHLLLAYFLLSPRLCTSSLCLWSLKQDGESSTEERERGRMHSSYFSLF